ncbi:hypothetical protein [Listeria grayi]|uniref:hypothetical protein n=1 Tax=Listeria grayi TaxID=1641 RepID=UPI001624837B|nr:hypothetical protein [Listeria grayi]MBC1921979.1 hypothetical protein [Listeria grayi]
MKYIFCQPANVKFKWQLQVALHNLKKHGIKEKDIVLLFLAEDNNVATYFEQKGYEVHVYSEKIDKTYLPSIKPFLWWKYLDEDSEREKERYFYLDSDVIFRKKVDIRKMPAKEDVWYCSDCAGYLSLDYIRQCEKGGTLLQNMADIVGVTIESLETINFNSGGAQWVITKPTAAYWHKVYKDSNKLFRYLTGAGSDIQAWTAEMWSQLWNMMYFNIGPKVSEELDFCWATDDIKRWKEVKIYHDAGVTEDMHDLFYKGNYNQSAPFKDSLANVSKTKCSYMYVKAIKEAMEE